MTSLLAIDPGYAGRGCALALYVHGVLVRVWFELREGDREPLSHAIDLVVVERPQQDERSRPIPPSVLIGLAWAGAAVAYEHAGRALCPVIELTPTEWKGSEPKPVQHARLLESLARKEVTVLGGSTTERTVARAVETGALDRWGKPGVAYYPRAFDTHNLLDAAALGATYLGRLNSSVFRRKNG